MSQLPTDVGRILERLRTENDRKQSEIAEAMGLHPSRISRLETGAAQAEPEEIEGYLAALASDTATLYRDILAERWTDISQPNPWHPNARALLRATRVVHRLDDETINDPKLTQSLAGQARFLRGQLLRSASYLMIESHGLGYMGKIGDGKTTAICFQTGLTRPSRKQPRDLRDECLLATQHSRTTLCEVIVRGEPLEKGNSPIRFRVTVEPVPNEEIYRLVRELASDLWDRRNGVKRSADESRGPSIEVERALRNMAGLKTQEVELPDGSTESRREEIEIAKNATSIEELQSVIGERLQLFRRTERELVWTGVKESEGRDWLKKTFAAINLGLSPSTSLPARITVTAPFAIMPGSPFDIEVVDTRGIDGSATRPDIQAVLDDPRCVPILCTTLGDAPGPHYDLLFSELAETGRLRKFEERAVLLILDQEKQALKVQDDSTGLDVETVEQGRRIKRAHARRELERRGLGDLPILFFNASEDSPAKINAQLQARILDIREREADRLERVAEAIETLIKNREEATAATDLRIVVEHLQSVVERVKTLAPSVRPFFEALLRQLSHQSTHQRSVLASVTRAGSWWNFDVYHALGSGAAEDANLRAREAIDAIRVALMNFAKDDKYESCRGFLVALSESVDNWYDAFLVAVRQAASEACRPVLSSAGALWTRCAADYRPGFKMYVRNHLKEYLEHTAPRSMHIAIEDGMRRAWVEQVIEPLERALGTALPKNDLFSEAREFA